MILNQELGFAELRRIKDLDILGCLFNKRLLLKAFKNLDIRQHCFYSVCAFGTVGQIKQLLEITPNLVTEQDAKSFEFLSLLGALKYECQPSVRLKKLDVLAANQFNFSQASVDGSTLVHFAANKNLTDCVNYLMQSGCNLHQKNVRNETPFGWIVIDNEDLGKAFLDSSTDLTASGLLGPNINAHHRNHPKILASINNHD